MFYISSHKYKGSVEVWGVTDTDDGIEEFYTLGQLGKFFKENGIRINGLVYTGSSFKCYIKSLAIIALEGLQIGDSFILKDDKTAKQVLYVGRTSLDDFNIFYDGSICKLMRKELLQNKDKYYIDTKGISKDVDISLKKAFVKAYPTSQLSAYLEF